LDTIVLKWRAVNADCSRIPYPTQTLHTTRSEFRSKTSDSFNDDGILAYQTRKLPHLLQYLPIYGNQTNCYRLTKMNTKVGSGENKFCDLRQERGYAHGGSNERKAVVDAKVFVLRNGNISPVVFLFTMLLRLPQTGWVDRLLLQWVPKRDPQKLFIRNGCDKTYLQGQGEFS
jgi:hypothetical protein